MRLVMGIFLLSICGSAWPHGGGLDANGCHMNRKTGEYHCHRGQKASAPTVQRFAGSSSGRVAYANCSEARAAGAAPIRRGQPGYAAHLDRDDDGVACE